MEKLLIYRERFLKFLTARGTKIRIAARFIGGVLLFFVLSQIFGYADILSEPFIYIIMGLICVFVPTSAVFMLTQIVTVLQLSRVTAEIAVFYLVLIFVYYLAYQRIFAKEMLLFLATPILFYFHVPAVLPILVGAFIGLSGLPAILMGAFLYYLAIIVQESVLSIENGTVNGELYSLVLQGATKNKELVLCILVFILVAAVVAGIRRLHVAYAWYIAILAGGILYLLLMLTGGYFVGSEVYIIGEIFTILFSIFIVIVVQFLYNVIDYTREEFFEFEDEEYYYYVRAIPKISVEEEDVNITNITMPVRKFYLKKRDKHSDEGEES